MSKKHPEKVKNEASTKQCPHCGNTNLVRISTQNLKFCTDCCTWIEWTRDEDQGAYL